MHAGPHEPPEPDSVEARTPGGWAVRVVGAQVLCVVMSLALGGILVYFQKETIDAIDHLREQQDVSQQMVSQNLRAFALRQEEMLGNQQQMLYRLETLEQWHWGTNIPRSSGGK